MVFRVRVNFVVFFIVLSGLFACSRDKEFTERKQLFDLNWRFYQGDVPAAFKMDFNDKLWQSIDLPHDWSLDKTLGANRIDEKGASRDYIGWYRKKFILPSDWQNMRIIVQFENYNLNAAVYINGTYLGANSDTSESFLFDITPYLKCDKENLIAIQVDHSDQKGNNWKKGTGISQHVWLLLSDPISTKK